MNAINSQVATKTVSKLLRGAQLDTIRVFSVIVQLGFIRIDIMQDLPQEIWIVISGNLRVEKRFEKVFKKNRSGDYFGRRANALSDCYRLIGREVIDVSVLDSGRLEISINQAKICVEMDQEGNLEEVWSVMSESPNPVENHEWYVALDDSGQLSARLPSLPVF
jgi:hypothetical protein